MRRSPWQERIEQLDPRFDFTEIARLDAHYEFPWDIQQALSFALFRTFAVPSIGVLLYETGEFTERVQKRYDDTGLILEEVLCAGFGAAGGRAAIRRMNGMHRSYDISNDDFRYVLATFVVCPVRWLAQYGWRELSRSEIDAATNYYRELGKHMGIRDIPETYEEFETLLDDYEVAHFAYDERARKVADSTLDLLATFMPFRLLPAAIVRRVALALMDDRLLDAFEYRRPSAAERFLAGNGLRLRALVVRMLPPRKSPRLVADDPNIRSYPGGYRVEELGTFPSGCPVRSHESQIPTRDAVNSS